MSCEIGSIKSLTEKLIEVPSITGDHDACRVVLDRASEELQAYPSKEFINEGVVSRLFYNTPELPDQFRIILNGHLDVVPGIGQYQAYEQEGKLYGRGAGDMKGAVAVQLAVFKEIASRVSYPLGFMLVTDEETGGYHGTGYQMQEGIRTDFAIIGEPTGLRICHRLKGRLGIQVSIASQSAHAAYPARVTASTDQLANFMKDVRKIYPTPKLDEWRTTVAITDFGTSHGNSYGNHIPNTIPSKVFCDLDVRHIPETSASQVRKNLQSIAPENTIFTIKESFASAYTDPIHPDIVVLQQIIQQITGNPEFAMQHGSCDFRWFTQAGSAGIALGPQAENTHGENESVSLASLQQYRQLLETFLCKINMV